MSDWDVVKVPKLVPLFPARAQDSEVICGHHGPLSRYTRFYCPCCHKTGATYERRLQAALAQERAQARAAQEATERRWAAERQAARLRKLRRGLNKVNAAG